MSFGVLEVMIPCIRKSRLIVKVYNSAQSKTNALAVLMVMSSLENSWNNNNK